MTHGQVSASSSFFDPTQKKKAARLRCFMSPHPAHPAEIWCTTRFVIRMRVNLYGGPSFHHRFRRPFTSPADAHRHGEGCEHSEEDEHSSSAAAFFFLLGLGGRCSPKPAGLVGGPLPKPSGLGLGGPSSVPLRIIESCTVSCVSASDTTEFATQFGVACCERCTALPPPLPPPLALLTTATAAPPIR